MNGVPSSLSDRRANASDSQLLMEYGERRRFYNQAYGAYVVKVFAGEWVISDQSEELLATVLGSCVSACVRDPVLGVGGMNHFLLPGDDSAVVATQDAARYGVYAMESLINALLKAGAMKSRLEFKVFGGGNVTTNSARIGSKNAAFIKSFLRREGYLIHSEDLEGEQPRSLHYYPVSGRVMLRKLRRREDFAVVTEEASYQQRITARPIEGDIELF